MDTGPVGISAREEAFSAIFFYKKKSIVPQILWLLFAELIGVVKHLVDLLLSVLLMLADFCFI